MAFVQFISEAEFLRQTVCNENIDSRLLTPVIKEAQEIRIQTILGSGLYLQVQSEIAGTLSGPVKTLLDEYVLPALIQWIKYEATPELLFKITNKSISIKTSENSNPIGTGELNILRSQIKDKAEWYSERLRLYLVQNYALFPAYLNPGQGVDTLHPLRKVFDSGLYLGGSRNSGGSFEDRFQGNIDSNCR